MYNLYINTTGSNNKGSFKIDYRNKPLNFDEGTKIAFNNMLMYNSINNISQNLGNNVLYILARKYDLPTGTSTYVFDAKLPTAQISGSSPDSEGFYPCEHVSKDYPTFDDIFVKTIGDYRVYKIVFPDGQYSIEALDEAIAIRLAVDIDAGSAVYNIKDDSARLFIVTAEPTYGKVRFMIDKYQPTGNNYLPKFDIVFPPNFALENSIAKFLGIHTMTSTIGIDTNSDGAVDQHWYSFNESGDDSGLALTKADVNNGITSLNVRVMGGLFNGGYDSLSHESDILHSFNITASPGYPQDVSVNTLVFLDVLAVNRPINYLDFRITDQNGREIGTDITEDLSMVITIKEPGDN